MPEPPPTTSKEEAGTAVKRTLLDEVKALRNGTVPQTMASQPHPAEPSVSIMPTSRNEGGSGRPSSQLMHAGSPYKDYAAFASRMQLMCK